MRAIATIVFVLFTVAMPVRAQFDDLIPSKSSKKANAFAGVATMTSEIVPAKAKPGQLVTYRLTVSPKPGCWTYPANPPPNQLSKSKIKLPAAGDVVFVEPVTDPYGAKEKPNPLGGTDLYYSAPVTWEFKAIVSPKALAGKRTITLSGTSIQACNDSNCFYSDLAPSAEIEILAGPADAVPPQYASFFNDIPPSPATVVADTPTVMPKLGGLIQKTPIPTAEYENALKEVQSKLTKGDSKLPSNSLWAFLITAAVWGWISLATPCVFPMIPITVSLFLKQGQQSPRQVLRLATVYSLTIIAVLGVSAIALLSVFQQMSVNPYMNIFLAGLFLFFALSLFGMYDISLPGFLLRYSEKKRSGGGMLGTIFGAIAFSIVSFTCVAPFLGGFAGMAASGQFSLPQLVAGGIAFSAAFASPFFLLALFPSLIKKLPRSGGWLDTVKVVMGFLEVAAALKFLRTAEVRWPPVTLFTYDFVLSAWVALSIACGLYLLNVFRLPHDEEKPTVGVTRLMFALGFLGIGVYLAPAIFKNSDGQNQRPNGVVYAWVDSFLLPEATKGAKELPWSADLPAAIDKARMMAGKDGRYIFIDFTGETCTNCKLNEKNVFPMPEVDELLRRYTLVGLYTDGVPIDFFRSPPFDRDAEAKVNGRFQSDAFGTSQLPLYAILEPLADGTIRVVDVYDEGKINDVPRFIAFLKKPFVSSQK